MPLPPVTTIAACGSIITAFKSGWELSRMIKKKDLEKKLDKEARSLLKDLQKAYLDGLMTDQSFDKWYDRFLGALADKDTLELRKVRQHISLIRNDQARLTRRNTIANRTTYYDEKHVYHRSKPSRSHDHHSHSRRHSFSTSKPEYTVHEYEEERRKPSHVDTARAQRDYYYAHALPSPYKGMIEDTPREDKAFDEDSHKHGRGRTSRTTESYRSRSNSTYDRGRPRSRSSAGTNTTEKRRVVEIHTSSDADSEAETEDHGRRRGARHSHGGGGHARDGGASSSSRRRRGEWVDAGA